MEVIDLSLPIAPDIVPFRDPSGYSDPLTAVATWVSIGEKVGDWTSPYQVSLLQMGVHAGTHIDAPSHFFQGGLTVADLPVGALAGRAVVVDLRDGVDMSAKLRHVRERCSAPHTMPLVLTPPGWLSLEAVDEVIGWERPLIAFAGEEDADPGFVAVRRLLGAGRWLAGNLDPERARLVRDGDLLVVAPLRLAGLEGSPCRVLAIRGLESSPVSS